MNSTPERSRGLGSLAQAARGKQLKQAQRLLIVIGALTIIVNAISLALVRSQVAHALDKEKQKLRSQGMQIDPEKARQWEERVVLLSYALTGVLIALGVLFVVFGVIIKQYPVPITIISLVLYVGAAAIFGLLDPQTLLQAWIWKIIIIIGLAKAIQSAIAYQREEAAAAAADVEPAL